MIERKNIKTEKKKNSIINNEEKTFGKLCKLQKLIRKESSLKELCKKIFF